MKAKMSKKSTLTITIMACLLAVAVATTIVLAAFSASKEATTTITFSNGVQLKITGASQNETGNPDDVMSTGPATLYWNVTVGSSTNKTGSVGGSTGLDGSETVSLDAISIDVLGTPSATVYLAVKPLVAYGPTMPNLTDSDNSNDGTAVTVTTAAAQTSPAWTSGADGWKLITVALDSNGEATVAFSDAITIYTPTNTATDNTYAGRKYAAYIQFEASTVAIHTGS